MGEEKKNVLNFGSLAFTSLKKNIIIITNQKSRIKFRKENFLITFHPETINDDIKKNLSKIFKSLNNKKFNNYSFIFTAANNDQGGGQINKKIRNWVRKKKKFLFYSLIRSR